MLSATWKFEMTKRSICLPSGWRKAHTCGIRYRLLPTRRRLAEVNQPLPCSVLEFRDVVPNGSLRSPCDFESERECFLERLPHDRYVGIDAGPGT